MHEIIMYIVSISEQLWYTWIFIMMVLESSFFPFPSELAMIPAWYLSSIWEMNFSIALIVWTFWALVWATINYFLWYYLWWKIIKSLIHKYWKYLLISEEYYKKSEKYFRKHWSITTFIARFITIVRQLISLPAWIFKMNFSKFFFYTWLWAWIWNLLLMIIWYVAWKNTDLIKKFSNELIVLTSIGIAIILALYFIRNNRKKVTKK